MQSSELKNKKVYFEQIKKPHNFSFCETLMIIKGFKDSLLSDVSENSPPLV